MKTKENGVTLIVLVITIILLLILTSIGVSVGTTTIDTAKFTQFKTELKVMQNKINELNQKNKIDIGQELTNEQKNILNIKAISDIIFNGKNDEERAKIQNGFRYYSKDCINIELSLDSVKRDYLVNVEYRYVIFPDGFENEKTIYYMIDQIEDEIYNVRYNDKNEKSGSFEVNTTKEENKWKVEIFNIQNEGYVDKWQVKYKLEGATYWETSNDLTFYLRNEGTYTIKVIHGDEIDLGTKSVKILYDGLISDKVKNEIIKIGDYVQYTPDTVSKTDSVYTNLISELETYSGSTENTTSTLTQESLNWRVLDKVKDEDGNYCVRLISEVPTESTVALEGYNGYNNTVYLIDNACRILYNSSYASNVQNLKIEDIQDYLTYDYTQYENSNVDTGKYGGTATNSANKNYPNIFAKEKTGWVNETQGTELGLSEQTDLITGSTQASTSIKMAQTYWSKFMNSADFKNSMYYTLFINNGSNYSTYWMSSRCVNVTSDCGSFFTRYVSGGSVCAYTLYNSWRYYS